MQPILILAGAPVGWLDRSAGEVASSIVDHRGPDGIIAVGAIELASAGWSHRVVDGRATTTVRFKDGTTIDTDAVGAVLNLMQSLPAIGFRRSSERDRAYADMELQALFVSFLRSFRCPVVNGVDGQGPLGVWSPLRWAVLAHRCGIETWPDGLSTGSRLLTPRTTPADVPVASTAVTIVGDQVFGAASTGQAEQCRRLAQLAGCELLGLTFDGGTGRMLAADPFPPVADDAATEVARLLCRHAASSTERVAS
jgi:hypothetical protein